MDNFRWLKSEEYEEQLASCEGQPVEDYITSLDFSQLVAALQSGSRRPPLLFSKGLE